MPSAVPDTLGYPTPPQLLKHGETLLLQQRPDGFGVFSVVGVFCGCFFGFFSLRVCPEAELRQPLPASRAPRSPPEPGEPQACRGEGQALGRSGRVCLLGVGIRLDGVLPYADI